MKLNLTYLELLMKDREKKRMGSGKYEPELSTNFTLISRIGYLIKLYDYVHLPKAGLDIPDLDLLREYFLVTNFLFKDVQYIRIEKK